MKAFRCPPDTQPSSLRFDDSLLVVAAGNRLEFIDMYTREKLPLNKGSKVLNFEIISTCFDETNLVAVGAHGNLALCGPTPA